MTFSEIKIIIWDLDGTLWERNLGRDQEPIVFSSTATRLIELAHRKGILNYLLTHNEKCNFERYIKENSVFKECFFGFSANFEPKAPQIEALLSAIGLRSSSALFIDDSASNLNSTKILLPSIHTSPPSISLFTELEDTFRSKDTCEIDRTTRYKEILNRSIIAKSNESHAKFLHESELKISYVDFRRYEEALKGRKRDLIERAYQLNYTKDLTKEDRISISKSGSNTFLMVFASDKYGDHGAIGFVAYSRHNVAWQFVFSCRVLGTGIPSFVFHDLHLHSLVFDRSKVAEPLSETKPHWIQLDRSPSELVSLKREMYARPTIITGSLCYYQSLLRNLAEYPVFSLRKFRARNLVQLDDWVLDYDLAVLFLIDDHLDESEGHFLSVADSLLQHDRSLLIAPPPDLFTYAKHFSEQSQLLADYTSDERVIEWHQKHEQRRLDITAKCQQLENMHDRVHLIDTVNAVEKSIDEQGTHAFFVPSNPTSPAFYSHSRFTYWLGSQSAIKIRELRAQGAFLY